MVDISPGSGTVVADASGRQILRDVYALKALKDKTLKEAKDLEYYAKFLKRDADAYKHYLSVEIPADIHNNTYPDGQEYQEKILLAVMDNAFGNMTKNELHRFETDYIQFQTNMGQLPAMYAHVHDELKSYEYWMLDL